MSSRRLAEQKRRHPGLLGPTLAMLVTLAILLGLGTWQLSRRTWKEALIETIHSRTAGEPIVFDVATALFRAGEDIEYTPVRVRGRFLPAKIMLYFAPDQKLGPGYHIYLPLETPSGEWVIVNQGYIPERELDAVKRRIASPPEPATEVVGLLRRPASKGVFSPANDHGRNLWYWRDIGGMAAHIRDVPSRLIHPFFLESLDSSRPISAGMGKGGATRIDLPNRHFEYAMTWYGLALALIGVYFFFLRARIAARRALPH